LGFGIYYWDIYSMCGITGIIQSDPTSFNKHHLKKMTDALAHRGPDGEGLWQNDAGNVLFGHRRLSIIDLSYAGHQPMHFSPLSTGGEQPSITKVGSEARGARYTIIHNGEIYNYIELKAELQKKGYLFRSQTDTEVIIASYDCWGDECLPLQSGMTQSMN
jgi:asparagine synthase (glutamine-hydrolysing)